MSTDLRLTKDNIAEWKAVLSMEMFRCYEVEDYANTVSDEEWLDNYEGDTVDDAISDEVSNWD